MVPQRRREMQDEGITPGLLEVTVKQTKTKQRIIYKYINLISDNLIFLLSYNTPS